MRLQGPSWVFSNDDKEAWARHGSIQALVKEFWEGALGRAGARHQVDGAPGLGARCAVGLLFGSEAEHGSRVLRDGAAIVYLVWHGDVQGRDGAATCCCVRPCDDAGCREVWADDEFSIEPERWVFVAGVEGEGGGIAGVERLQLRRAVDGAKVFQGGFS